jgi:hypothetical protein
MNKAFLPAADLPHSTVTLPFGLNVAEARKVSTPFLGMV